MELYMAQLASVYNRHQSRHLVSWPEYDYIIPGHSTYTAWSVLRDWWADRHRSAAGHRADLAAVAGTSNTYINIQRQKTHSVFGLLVWNYFMLELDYISKAKVRVIGSGFYTKGNSKHQPGKIMQKPTEIQFWFQCKKVTYNAVSLMVTKKQCTFSFWLKLLCQTTESDQKLKQASHGHLHWLQSWQHGQ